MVDELSVEMLRALRRVTVAADALIEECVRDRLSLRAILDRFLPALQGWIGARGAVVTTRNEHLVQENYNWGDWSVPILAVLFLLAFLAFLSTDFLAGLDKTDQVLNRFALHYKTGQPMPQALVDKMKKAGKFNSGYNMTELVAAAMLDMNWHMLGADAPLQDADKFEAASLKKDGVDLSYVPPRYRSSYFQHIWGNGYAAGYYAYLWTEMLADDAFIGFKEHGGMTRENGDRFRKMVLSRGNTEDLAKMYQAWRGEAPSIEPMLENRGLKEAPKK